MYTLNYHFSDSNLLKIIFIILKIYYMNTRNNSLTGWKNFFLKIILFYGINF